MGKRRPATELLPHFFSRFFGKRVDGYVELRVFPNAKGPIVDRAWVRDAVDFTDFVEMYNDKSHDVAIYFGPMIRRRKGGKKADLLDTFALWAEIDTDKLGWDHREVAKVVHALEGPLQPSLCIHSGHGLHLYWYLDESETDIPRIEGMNALLRDMVAGDRVQDATRVMRVPWTWNTKHAPVRSSVLWHYHWHTTDITTLHDAVAEFDSTLVGDRFVTNDEFEKLEAARRATAMDPERAAKIGTEDRRKKVNARGNKIWEQCTYGGGRGHIGLDEAILLYTAHRYCQLDAPTEAKLEAIITDTLTRVEEIKARDAPNERWDWDEEEREVRAKLMRWVKRWDEIKDEREKEGKRSGAPRRVRGSRGGRNEKAKA